MFNSTRRKKTQRMTGTLRLTQLEDRVVPSMADLAMTNPLAAFGAGPLARPHARFMNMNTQEYVADFFPYDFNFRGGVRAAVGDFNADGFADMVTAPGSGGGPHIRIYDFFNTNIIREFMAYDVNFTGGVNIAVADVNGDGFDDLVTGAGHTGGPHVKIFNGRDGSLMNQFMAYDPAFRGGVRVGAADLNSQGIAQIVTGAGIGGGPIANVFNAIDGQLLDSFLAFEETDRGGIYVATADMTGDGIAEVFVGSGVNRAPSVGMFGPGGRQIASSITPYVPEFLGGVNVVARDVTGDGIAELITGAAVGGGPHVQVFDGVNHGLLTEFMAFDPEFLGGVYVG
jgi:hypothetical protein